MRKLSFVLMLLYGFICAQGVNRFTVDKYSYEVNEDGKTVSVTSGDYAQSHLSIPSEVLSGGVVYRVTAINWYAFDNYENLVSVDIPESIVEIYGDAFRNCINLQEIKIPDSVLALGDWSTFEGCKSLKNVVLSKNLKTLGNYVFSGCTSLESIVMPDALEVISEGAFYGCTSLGEISIGRGLRTVQKDAFKQCAIRRVNVADLDAWCNISFPSRDENPASIAHDLYVDGEPLSELNISDGVKTINSNVFSGLESLRSVVLPSSITRIEASAFNACSSLNELNVEAVEVPFLGSDNFNDFTVCRVPDASLAEYRSKWTNIRHIIGGEHQSIICRNDEAGSLINSIPLKEVLNITGLQVSGKINGTDLAAINRMINLLILDLSDCEIEEGGIPYYLIGDTEYRTKNNTLSAYWNHSIDAVQELSLPKTLQSIELGAFDNGMSFVTINLGRSLTEILPSQFSKCKHLQKISLPSSLEKIGDAAFKDCSLLQSISIPDKTKTIGANAFNGCKGLKSVKMSLGIERIGDSAFNNCHELESIFLPDKLNGLGNYTFSNCSKIKKVALAGGISKLPSGVFSGCTSLEKVYMPASITEIAQRAFAGCNVIEDVYVSSSVPASVSSDSFENYKSTLYVPASSYNDYWLHDVWGLFSKIETWVPVSKISISESEISLKPGEKIYVDATIAPAEAYQTVQWSSSDEDVVSVSAEGLLIAQSEGKAIITVSATDSSGVFAQCMVSVTNGEAGVKPSESTDVKVNVAGDTVYIDSVVGEKVVVLRPDGVILLNEFSEGERIAYTSSTRQILIIVVGNKSFKVIL